MQLISTTYLHAAPNIRNGDIAFTILVNNLESLDV